MYKKSFSDVTFPFADSIEREKKKEGEIEFARVKVDFFCLSLIGRAEGVWGMEFITFLSPFFPFLLFMIKKDFIWETRVSRASNYSLLFVDLKQVSSQKNEGKYTFLNKLDCHTLERREGISQNFFSYFLTNLSFSPLFFWGNK